MPIGWGKRSADEVKERIEKLSGESIAALEKATDSLLRQAKSLQTEVVTEISGLHHQHGLEQEKKLLNDLEKFKWGPSINEIIRANTPTQVVSRDSEAVYQGMLEAWASHKSFRPVDAVAKDKKDKKDDEPKPPAPRWDENNPTINYRGEKRSNQTHCSTTDPEAMLARKGRGKEAKLSYHGHLMTENRSGLVVSTLVTTAYGAAECHAGLLMAEKLPGRGRVTLGADKGYDQREFIDELRQMEITPHVAQNQSRRRSRVDRRTTRHSGYEVSQRKRKRIEEVFGWMKTVGLLRKLRHRGLERVGWMFTLAAATYNLVRMRTLMPKCA